MSVTYTSRKRRTYFLCQGITRSGKPRYYFAIEPKDKRVEKLPDGYQVQESVNGIVSLVRIRPSLLSKEDIIAVEAALQIHSQAIRYRVSIKSEHITIYEMVGPDLAELSASMGCALDRDTIKRLENSHTQFQPIMRFILKDKAKHLFTAQRMSYFGDNWVGIEFDQPISALAARLIPKLGTDAFYDLF